MQKISLILITCLATPFGLLPLRWAQAIGGYLGLILIKHNKKRAHIALSNIQTCFPEKTSSEHEALLKATAIEAGKWFMESAHVWFRNPQYLINKVSVNNPEMLETAYQKGKGVVIVLPHLGNWELLNFFVPQHYPFGAMYRPIKSPLFEKIIFNSRSRVGTSMFAATPQGVRKALKALKKNYVIAILSDHLPSEEAGVHAPFFGRPALTGKLTQALAKCNNSEVLLASVIRQEKGQGFVIHFDNISNIASDDAVGAATTLNKAIEKGISLAPEQYQWVYRRFAKPPAGVESIYKDC